ncbi:hypothetical protein TanjilG_22662 [Lupinus angustifolius]|uniref:Uncharacterized protein n=1 Tax=Lupinus angustifolius TaxID=3871 RepID=A0A1J7H555_LUPAN|nr:PREDICTED: uncharacterized protein LOC109359409 [Lupinus angustifolius]OIW01618.1 hypothetical protein TanjilG_22662 [Lupinus angustifolius]
MWNLLIASAVAGSTGFVTKRLLTPRNTNHVDNIKDPNSNDSSYESDTLSDSETQFGNRVFVFSTSESLNLRESGGSHSRSKPRGSQNGVWVSNVEHRNKGGKRLPPFCYNKKKSTNKVLVEKVPSFSSKDDSLSLALGLGIVYMMSAEKAEINKLNKTMKGIAVSVQELKSDLDRRKPSRAHRKLDSDGDIDLNSRKMRGEHGEVMLEKRNTEFRGTDVKISSPFVHDSGECGSSALTEEPEPQVLEMDKLEAELEFEFEKLSGCTIDSPCREETKPTLDELEVQDEDCNRMYVPNFNYSQSHGVLASELNQKLSELLIKQQENQISELESELHLAQSNLQQKEAELQALKDSVKHLTELSLSTVSDDETRTLNDPKGTIDLDNNNMQSFSKQSVVGAKRPFDSESCSYCMLNDSDLCEHSIIQGI